MNRTIALALAAAAFLLPLLTATPAGASDVVDPAAKLPEQVRLDQLNNQGRLLEAQLAGGPLFELRASVPNRPGVVAQLALELGRAGVNITDMALYPALDMSEGVIALWIAGEEQARRTEELVASLGFPVARA